MLVLGSAATIGMVLLRIVAFVPALVVTAIAALTLPPTAALSRAREHAADREASPLTGAPAALASALLRIEADTPVIPDRDLRAMTAANGLLIQPAPPGGLSAWPILRGHPPTSARVAALLDLQRRVDAPPVARE